MPGLPNTPLAGGLPTGAPPPAGIMPPKPPGGNVGPVSVPSINAGNQVQAHAAIKNAAEQLQQALVQMPMGSEEHTQLFEIVKKLSKIVADAPPDPHAQMQALVQQARAAGQGQGGGPPGLAGMMPPAQTPPSPAPELAQAA
jgi:hypothetical protein